MDGLECARNIRNYQRTGEMRSNLPIIAASANARIEQIQMALQAGMVSLDSKLKKDLEDVQGLILLYRTIPSQSPSGSQS